MILGTKKNPTIEKTSADPPSTAETAAPLKNQVTTKVVRGKAIVPKTRTAAAKTESSITGKMRLDEEIVSG